MGAGKVYGTVVDEKLISEAMRYAAGQVHKIAGTCMCYRCACLMTGMRLNGQFTKEIRDEAQLTAEMCERELRMFIATERKKRYATR